ncbi:MAG TPA: MarR family transcriptional regulator [Symbiobacteriaceae bacterium]|jgi:DNA-binding MarR family transcriptional regulator
MQGNEGAVSAFNPMDLLMAVADRVGKRSNSYLTTAHELTLPQYQLLLAAVDCEASTMGSLANQLNCTRGNLTGVVDRLERDRWLTRERSQEDRRVITVRPTEKGHRVHEIQKDLRARLSILTSVMSPDEVPIILPALARLRDELTCGLESDAVAG